MPGTPGYENYMSWVKQQAINGNQVTVAILINSLDDTQYDHFVTVVKIGTNHSPTDPTYYPDDVLYFDDHGNIYALGTSPDANSYNATPYGAGTDNANCTPYIFGYTFANLAQTRSSCNYASTWYCIVTPDDATIETYTGGDGFDTLNITGPNNFGFAVSGPLDTYGETLPVVLNGALNSKSAIVGNIVGPTKTGGTANPLDPIAGYDYENPFIGTSKTGGSCTNSPPSSWMTNVVLQPVVSGLTSGVSYNLYEYVFSVLTGTPSGPAPALAVPVTAFNANSAAGSSTPYTAVTNFTASGPTYTGSTVTTTGDKIVVFRAVPASPGVYSPSPSSTLTGTSVTFAWDSSTSGAGPDYGATAYQLNVGKEEGGSEYYASGSLSNTTFSQTVSSLPNDGSAVWARWSYDVSGSWLYTDYQYTAEMGQTITFTTTPPASAAYGSQFTVAATGGASGNPVTFTSDGSCSNVGATYTMTSGTGTCSVIANQAGNALWLAAPTVTDYVTATKLSQAITFTYVPSSAAYNSQFTATATSSASPVVFTNDGSGVCSNWARRTPWRAAREPAR